MRADRLKPRHEVIRIEEEFRNGELSVAQFTADLREVPLALSRDGWVSAEIQENITGCLNIRSHIGVHGSAVALRRRALV